LHNTYDVMESIRRNFSKESYDSLLQEYEYKVEALEYKIEFLLAKIETQKLNIR